MKHLLRTALLALHLGAVHVPRAAPARADEGASAAPTYRALVDDAVREFSAGHYQEAHALFSRAHALVPSARTHRGLGYTEFELRNYPACVRELEAALGSTVQPLEPPLRTQAAELLGRARTFVGTLVVDTRPPAVSVRIDGQPAAPGAPLALNVGEHVVEAEAEGFAAETRRVQVQSGAEARLTVLFGQPLRAQPEAREEPARGRRWYKSPWLWSAVGVVAAGSATATALALRRDDAARPTFDGGSWRTLGTGP